MNRFSADEARALAKKNESVVLVINGEPDERIKKQIVNHLFLKIADGENRMHIYLDPADAPDSDMYFDPKDKMWENQLHRLDPRRKWIIKELVDAGYKVIASKEVVCRSCTGLPSNPCDECNGKKPVGVSFRRLDWVSYSYLEVRW